jgi:hypothetical protein
MNATQVGTVILAAIAVAAACCTVYWGVQAGRYRRKTEEILRQRR